MTTNATALPAEGFVRIKQILGVIPMSATQWRIGVAAGIYPAPVRLGPKMVVWNVVDIRNWMVTVGHG